MLHNLSTENDVHTNVTNIKNPLSLQSKYSIQHLKSFFCISWKVGFLCLRDFRTAPSIYILPIEAPTPLCICVPAGRRCWCVEGYAQPCLSPAVRTSRVQNPRPGNSSDACTSSCWPLCQSCWLLCTPHNYKDRRMNCMWFKKMDCSYKCYLTKSRMFKNAL